MENFQIEIQESPEKTLLLPLQRDPDLSTREGYDVNFLDLPVQLPEINEELKNQIAINKQPNRNGSNVLDYTHFSVVFNKTKKLPIYTVVNIEGKSSYLNMPHEERDSDAWYPDDRIKTDNNTHQYGNGDYSHSRFQKGHMVRYYDPAWGSETVRNKGIADTFYYTSCCPQVRGYNVGDWLSAENYYIARSFFQDDKVTVFSGPVFNKAIQTTKLLVPVNYWKVIVYKSKTTNKLEAIAFLISHEFSFEFLQKSNLLIEGKIIEPKLKPEDIKKYYDKIKDWEVKVSLIEEKTGLKFGLDNADINKSKEQYFYKDAEPMKSRKLVETKMGQLVEDYTQFIKDI